MNLSPIWQLIKTIISNQPVIHKTLNYIINTLTNYEIQLQKQEETKPQTTALVMVTNTNSQNCNAANRSSNWTRGCGNLWSHRRRCGRGHGQGYGRGSRDGRHSG